MIEIIFRWLSFVYAVLFQISNRSNHSSGGQDYAAVRLTLTHAGFLPFDLFECDIAAYFVDFLPIRGLRSVIAFRSSQSKPRTRLMLIIAYAIIFTRRTTRNWINNCFHFNHFTSTTTQVQPIWSSRWLGWRKIIVFLGEETGFARTKWHRLGTRK